MRNFKFKIAWLLLVFYCTGSQAQHNVAKIVAKEFEYTTKNNLRINEVVSDLLVFDGVFNDKNINPYVKESKYLNYNKSKGLELISKNDKILSLEVFSNDGERFILDLVNTSDYFSNIKITTGSGKNFDFASIKSVFYAGNVRGKESSIVSVSIFENEMVGMISIGGIGGNLVIGKMKNSNLHIVYNDKAIPESEFDCKTDTSKGETNRTENLLESAPDGISIVNKCIKIYYETEFDIFQDKGSIANVVTYITAMHNIVATIFSNEGLLTPLNTLKVWDTEDPYVLPASTPLLQQFTDLNLNMNENLGQLLTFRFGGGQGWLGFGVTTTTLCTTNRSNLFGYSGIQNTFNNFPLYTGGIKTICHEFGHNLSSQHTHQCIWQPNNMVIDLCAFGGNAACENPIYTFNPFSSNLALGTIMSYCQSGFMNFTTGFGLQPGNKIRNFVKNSTCLQACTTCQTDLIVNNPITTTKYHQVTNSIVASSTIVNNVNVNFKAQQVLLQNGFHMKADSSSSNFSSMVDPCTNGITSSKSSGLIFNNARFIATNRNNDFEIIGLEIFPNPLADNKVFFIKSNLNNEKEIVIYNLLGKQVLNTTTSGNEINVSNFNAGVYIVKVTEEGKTATRKLVIQ